MKARILEYLQNNDRYIIKSDLIKKIKLERKEELLKEFDSSLTELIEEGLIYLDEKRGYRIFKNSLGVAFGEIEINKKGNGYVHTNDGYTIFIDKEDLNGSLHGDKVIVKSIDFGRKNDFKGEIDKIVKRKTGNVIFEVVGNGKEASLIPHNMNEIVPVHINKNQYKELLDGQLIRVNVGVNKNEDDEYFGEIEEVIGHKSDPGIDLRLIFIKNNVPLEFPKAVLEEAERLPKEVREEDLVGRVDLRDKDTVAIDCDETKDRDDSVYIERLANGNYKLLVNISHVSYYIKPGSLLYQEAERRCNSHYPNNTCIPMFPRIISNGICSLNEGVDRLTRTVEMEFDSNGKIVNYDIYTSVVNTKKNMKYSLANKVLNGEEVLEYAPYKEQLQLMYELSSILERQKQERNYLNFDVPEIKPIQNKEGITEGLKETKQGKSDNIIENFMLIGDSVGAEHYSWLPFIYRVHEAPNQELVQNVIKTLTISGFKIPKYKNIDEYSIKNILEHIKTKEEAMIVKTMLLKSMKHARYDIEPIGHFALQTKKHCHFTAPIRRNTDFRIHGLIDNIDNLDYSKESIEALEKELKTVAENASKMEKVSESIEREALMMAMAEYMQSHIGEEFGGIVTEVYPHGMFVRADNLVSGKVCFDDMGKDKFHYDDDKKAIIGKNTNKKFQIGNKVCVLVKSASKENRTIDFKIVDKPKQKILKKD